MLQGLIEKYTPRPKPVETRVDPEAAGDDEPRAEAA
jgi:hypothetical protein